MHLIDEGTNIEILPIAGRIGAEIKGVKLSRDLGPASVNRFVMLSTSSIDGRRSYTRRKEPAQLKSAAVAEAAAS
jgi:hypothetical protein